MEAATETAAVATGTEAMAVEAATETAAVATGTGYANADCASAGCESAGCASALATEAVLATVRPLRKHTSCIDRSRCPAWY
jgi:hypothetical protein